MGERFPGTAVVQLTGVSQAAGMVCRVCFHELPGCRGKMNFLLSGFPFVSMTQGLKPSEKGEEQSRGDEGRPPHCAGGSEHGLQLAGHELLIGNKSKTSCLGSCGATRASPALLQ